MKNFKITFPSRYQVIDYNNDNIDVNIILENGKVYFGTLFTLLNIEYLINKSNNVYFWSTNCVIITELKKETIRIAISKIIADDYLGIIFSDIGTIGTVFPDVRSFSEIVDMTL
jgi:hypothetical protein